MPTEDTLGEDNATDGGLIELRLVGTRLREESSKVGTLIDPGLADGGLGAGIVKEGGLAASGFAGDRLIEFRPTDTRGTLTGATLGTVT